MTRQQLCGCRKEKDELQPLEQRANAPEKGPLGFGVMPSLKRLIQQQYLTHFLAKVNNEELMVGPFAHQAVAHVSKARDRNSMNIAFPDLSAEYWITLVPPTQAPIFVMEFPKWAIYCAYTAYDASGLPIASINALQAENGNDPRVENLGDNKKRLNLMQGLEWKGPLVAILRIYRPQNVEICPRDQLPEVFFLPKDSLEEANMNKLQLVSPATEKFAMERGRAYGEKFRAAVATKLKPLQPAQLGSQLFFPTNIAGLYPNANARYVVCFLPANKSGIRVQGFAPALEKWRCYYGYMAVDKISTRTVDSKTVEDLGGWGSDYALFAFRDTASAEAAGYDAGNPSHKLLLFGGIEACPQPGLVLRYLHYFTESSGLSSTEIAAARSEQEALERLDGTKSRLGEISIPGISQVQYV